MRRHRLWPYCSVSVGPMAASLLRSPTTTETVRCPPRPPAISLPYCELWPSACVIHERSLARASRSLGCCVIQQQSFEMFDSSLPLNRKERFYTGTVLPMLIASDGFMHLNRFLRLCSAPTLPPAAGS